MSACSSDGFYLFVFFKMLTFTETFLCLTPAAPHDRRVCPMFRRDSSCSHSKGIGLGNVLRGRHGGRCPGFLSAQRRGGHGARRPGRCHPIAACARFSPSPPSSEARAPHGRAPRLQVKESHQPQHVGDPLLLHLTVEGKWHFGKTDALWGRPLCLGDPGPSDPPPRGPQLPRRTPGCWGVGAGRRGWGAPAESRAGEFLVYSVSRGLSTAAHRPCGSRLGTEPGVSGQEAAGKPPRTRPG